MKRYAAEGLTSDAYTNNDADVFFTSLCPNLLLNLVAHDACREL